MRDRKKYTYRVGERVFWPDGSAYGHTTGTAGTVTDLNPEGYPGCVEVVLDDHTVGSARNRRVIQGRVVHLGTTGECIPLREVLEDEIAVFQRKVDVRRKALAEMDDLGRYPESEVTA